MKCGDELTLFLLLPSDRYVKSMKQRTRTHFPAEDRIYKHLFSLVFFCLVVALPYGDQ